jgi:hypothetical protein
MAIPVIVTSGIAETTMPAGICARISERRVRSVAIGENKRTRVLPILSPNTLVVDVHEASA